MVTGVAVDGDTAVVAVAPCCSRRRAGPGVHGVVAEAVLAGTDAQRVEVDLREMTGDEKQAAAACSRARSASAGEPAPSVGAPAAHRPHAAQPVHRLRTRVLAIAPGKGAGSASRRSPRTSRSPRRRGRAAAVDADVWGFSMPPHARDPQSARPDRRRDRPARGPRRAPISMGFFVPRTRPSLARPDAPQGARAVPHRRALGRPRLPRRRHAARHR
jgi:hypothetical protein